MTGAGEQGDQARSPFPSGRPGQGSRPGGEPDPLRIPLRVRGSGSFLLPDQAEEHQPETNADGAEEQRVRKPRHGVLPSGGRICTVSWTTRVYNACPVSSR